MRSLLSWITDVRVHLLVSGILLLHFAINFGTYSDPVSKASSPCHKCGYMHGSLGPRSSLALNHAPYGVAR